MKFRVLDSPSQSELACHAGKTNKHTFLDNGGLKPASNPSLMSLQIVYHIVRLVAAIQHGISLTNLVETLDCVFIMFTYLTRHVPFPFQILSDSHPFQTPHPSSSYEQSGQIYLLLRRKQRKTAGSGSQTSSRSCRYHSSQTCLS
jgi:hypothetical protein